jgi:pimeloyl-ACP methyl ester carboxylesterase
MTEALPTILIPGLLCTPRLYADQIPALWRFGAVTIADHRHDDSMDGIAARILKAAPPRFALAGLSMGGYIAYAVLRAAPERVARLALIDTSARADLPEQSERRKAQIALAQSGKLDEVVEAMLPLFLPANRLNDAALVATVRQMARETGADAFVRQQRAIMGRPDSRPDLPAIRCPTLVIVGEHDALTPPKVAREIAEGIAGSKLLVVPDCGHLSTLERPEAVTRALVEWMQ